MEVIKNIMSGMYVKFQITRRQLHLEKHLEKPINIRPASRLFPNGNL